MFTNSMKHFKIGGGRDYLRLNINPKVSRHARPWTFNHSSMKPPFSVW
jgi:hypothetical protein